MKTVQIGMSGSRIRTYTAREIAGTFVGEGWFEIIDSLINDLYNLGWDGKVAQIKEKFGGLRFYPATKCTDEMFARITQAEEASVRTCEVTGEAGELRPELSWLKTLSDKEFEKAMARQRERFGDE